MFFFRICHGAGHHGMAQHIARHVVHMVWQRAFAFDMVSVNRNFLARNLSQETLTENTNENALARSQQNSFRGMLPFTFRGAYVMR